MENDNNTNNIYSCYMGDNSVYKDEYHKYMKHQIEVIKSKGFNPIGYTTMLCEETYVFETDEEAQLAFEFFENNSENLDKYEICGWWYGIDRFENERKDYNKDF